VEAPVPQDSAEGYAIASSTPRREEQRPPTLFIRSKHSKFPMFSWSTLSLRRNLASPWVNSWPTWPTCGQEQCHLGTICGHSMSKLTLPWIGPRQSPITCTTLSSIRPFLSLCWKVRTHPNSRSTGRSLASSIIQLEPCYNSSTPAQSCYTSPHIV
jgi:hypothetical protein